MKTIIVPKITNSQEMWHRRKSYPHAHRLANQAEKKAVGKKQFKYTSGKLRGLPKGHWAAEHTANGNVHISKEFLELIPKGKRQKIKKELCIHEMEEHKIMTGGK